MTIKRPSERGREITSLIKKFERTAFRIKDFERKKKLTGLQEKQLRQDKKHLDQLAELLIRQQNEIAEDLAEHELGARASSQALDELDAKLAAAAERRGSDEHEEAIRLEDEGLVYAYRRMLEFWEHLALLELSQQGWKCELTTVGWVFGRNGSWDYEKLPPHARLLIILRRVKDAIDVGDALASGAASLWLGAYLLATGEAQDLFPPLMEAAGPARQRIIAKDKPRSPKLRTRAVLAALEQGSATAEAIKNYLGNNQSVRDKWGEISIYKKGDGFEVIDEGAKLPAGDGARPCKFISPDDIPKIISAARKWLGRNIHTPNSRQSRRVESRKKN